MYVRFVWGAVAKYLNVPEKIFEGLIDSWSKYEYIQNNIVDKFKWEECYAPFFSYRGGKQGLAREQKKAQDRVNRRTKRNKEIKEVIEFLFNKLSPYKIESFFNSPSFSNKYKAQLKCLIFSGTAWGLGSGNVNAEWNYVLKQYPELYEKVMLILKKEKKRGVVNRKGNVNLYFYKSIIINSMRNEVWIRNGKWE